MNGTQKAHYMFLPKIIPMDGCWRKMWKEKKYKCWNTSLQSLLASLLVKLCCYFDNVKALSREVKIEKILLKMFPFASLSPWIKVPTYLKTFLSLMSFSEAANQQQFGNVKSKKVIPIYLSHLYSFLLQQLSQILQLLGLITET